MKEPVKGSDDGGLFVNIPADLPEMTLADALGMLVEEFGWKEVIDALAAIAEGDRKQLHRLRGSYGSVVWTLLNHSYRLQVRAWAQKDEA